MKQEQATFLQNYRERIVSDMVADVTVIMEKAIPARPVIPGALEYLATRVLDLTLRRIQSSQTLINQESTASLVQSTFFTGQAGDVVCLFLSLKRAIAHLLKQKWGDGPSVESVLAVSEIIDQCLLEFNVGLIRLFGDVMAKETKRLQSYMAKTTEMVLLFHCHSGTILDANRVAEQQLGYDKEQLQQKTFFEFISRATQAAAARVLDELKERHFADSQQIELTTRDSQTIPVMFNPMLRETLGYPLVIAIINDLTEKKQAERRLRVLKGLYEIAQGFSAIRNPQVVYGQLAKRVAELIGATKCFVANYDPQSKEIRAVLPGYNVSEELMAAARFFAGGRMKAQWNLRRRGPFIANQIADMPAEIQQFAQQFGIQNSLAVAMLAERKVIGIIYAANKAGGFTPEDARLLSIFASQAAAVIQNTQLYQRLAASEAKYRDLFENAPIGIYQTAPDGKILVANSALVQMLGYENAVELLKGSLTDLFVNPADQAGWLDELERQSVRKSEDQLRRRDGTVMWVRNLARAVRDSTGYPLYYEGTLTDITQRKRAEERINLVVESAPNAIVMVNQRGQIVLVNSQTEKSFGYNRDELIGESVEMLVPQRFRGQHPDARQDFFTEPRARAMGAGRDLYGLRKDGSEFPVEIGLNPIETAEGTLVLSAIVDITERKRIEEQIRASLKEKEVLLKEIHHRVKNNLQVISSLLNLQAGYIKDQQVLELFKESQNRVKSMALIHETLYQSDDLARIDFAEYTRNLAAYLFRSYGVNSNVIALKTHLDQVLLGVDTAIPCGLIINELVSNSLKHAFPPNRTGEIQIDFRANHDHQLTLTVRDNGVGFPRNVDFRTTESLGLQLVTGLTEQLGGTIEFDGSGGTTFKITLVESKDKERS